MLDRETAEAAEISNMTVGESMVITEGEEAEVTSELAEMEISQEPEPVDESL